MNANKLIQQAERRVEALDRRTAKNSNREPLPEINRSFYREHIFYEDAQLEVVVIDNREYLNGQYKGVNFDQRGPWLLFKVVEIESGDHLGVISEGAVVLAKWDRTYKVYKKFIYDGDPKPGNVGLTAIMAFIPVSENELITGKLG